MIASAHFFDGYGNHEQCLWCGTCLDAMIEGLQPVVCDENPFNRGSCNCWRQHGRGLDVLINPGHVPYRPKFRAA